ncbi:MAG: AAA family ATPase [Desulfurococcaceae archaeon]|uniref:AAA family ATPase n=1 Tax=Staphylothermus marinus TaxID=2280 RepID=A0A7C4JNM6_STAMA
MTRYLGVDVLDSVFDNSLLTLFYGPAGSGKTAFLTTIARNLCRVVYPCIYVNTEDPLFYDNIARMWDEYSNVFFIDIRDFSDFFDFVVKHIVRLPFKALFIDSVNSTYRLVAYSENSLTKFNLILALIARRAYETGCKVFASAQVRAEIDSDEVVVSGMGILKYWFNTICQLGWENNYRFIKIIKPPMDLKLYFKISNRGVELLDH